MARPVGSRMDHDATAILHAGLYREKAEVDDFLEEEREEDLRGPREPTTTMRERPLPIV